MKTLTYHQIKALDELNDGGKIFLFEDGTVGLDSVYGDTLKFRKPTFNILIERGLIEPSERPNIGTEIYKISEKGKVIL